MNTIDGNQARDLASERDERNPAVDQSIRLPDVIASLQVQVEQFTAPDSVEKTITEISNLGGSKSSTETIEIPMSAAIRVLKDSPIQHFQALGLCETPVHDVSITLAERGGRAEW